MSEANPASAEAGTNGGPRRGRRAVGRAIAWLGWWIVLMAFWVITDDSIAPDELLAGAGAAALAAFLVDLASRQASVTFAVRAAWLAGALRLPRQVLTETVIVFTALWRRLARGEQPPSGFVAEPVEYGPDTAQGVMRRALIVGARSLAPNTFVLGIDRDHNLMIMHKLVVDGQEPRR
ncbi:MAG TPA: Na+/H+ antiporter subunit E [Streptosporangiaceae bacterium]